MKYLITGYSGQLGYDIVNELKNRGDNEWYAPLRSEMDITNKEEVEKVILTYKPDVIVHCAAWTAVDKAEDSEEECYKTNVEATRNITDASLKIGAKLMYISTDYVFDGTKKEPYNETDEVNPMNTYGKTKYLGEEEVRRNPNHFINRISWVFGENGNNFIKTMLRLSETHNQLTVVCDQIGSPTYTKDLSKLLVDMSLTDKYGTYHSTNEEYCSWAEFAKYIFEEAGKDVEVIPVTTEEYLKGKKQAYRPKNSMLDKQKLEQAGFDRLPTWKDATKRYVKVLRKEEK